MANSKSEVALHITVAICLILLGLASSSIAVATVTSTGDQQAVQDETLCTLDTLELAGMQSSLDGDSSVLFGAAPIESAFQLSASGGDDNVAPPLWAVLLRYSRHNDSDPLENDVRNRIYEEIEDAPGTYITELSDSLAVSRSTVRYHVRILEDERLVSTENNGGKHRLFPTHSTDNPALAAALNDEATGRVIRTIDRLEPVGVSTLAQSLDRAPGTVTYHLDRLDEAGLIERERVGNAVHTRLADEIELDSSTAVRTANAD